MARLRLKLVQLAVAIRYVLILAISFKTVSASVVTAQLQADTYFPIKAVKLAWLQSMSRTRAVIKMTAICLVSAPAA